MRAIVIAAGDATRWGGHLGVPKHFVQVDGEPIIERTVRLLAGHAEIVVVGPPDPRYKLPDAALFVPYKDPGVFDADKFLNSRALWNRDGRTLVVYGDVYFTDEAIETIVGFDRREWQLFCRFWPNELTGRPWGECFAQSFWPEHHAEHEAALHRTVDLVRRGVMWRCGGWEHYRAMCGLPDERMPIDFHGDYGRATEIIDWTDDFDFPGDYDAFVARRAELVAA